MWGRTAKHSPAAAGTPSVELDLSSFTAAPSSDPINSTQAGAFQICADPTRAPSSRTVHDEIQAVLHVEGATGVAMDVRVWVWIPDFKYNTSTKAGTWKALRLLTGVPLDAETTDDKGTIYRIPVPFMATHMYLQRDSVTGSPTATEGAIYAGEETV